MIYVYVKDGKIHFEVGKNCYSFGPGGGADMKEFFVALFKAVPPVDVSFLQSSSVHHCVEYGFPEAEEFMATAVAAAMEAA